MPRWVNSPVGQLDGVTIGIFAIAKAERIAVSDVAETCASRHESFSQGSDVLGVKDDFGTFAAGRGGARVQGDSGTACGKLAPAFFARDLAEAEYLSVEFGHSIDLGSEKDDARQLH
jgi:hypothetical protein